MKQPTVTEHAMFRYLQRKGRIDVDVLAKEMLTPDLVAAVRAGATSFKHNGFTYIIDRGAVVTVIDSTSSLNLPKGQVR